MTKKRKGFRLDFSPPSFRLNPRTKTKSTSLFPNQLSCYSAGENVLSTIGKAGVFIESILLCLSCFGCRCGLVVCKLACL